MSLLAAVPALVGQLAVPGHVALLVALAAFVVPIASPAAGVGALAREVSVLAALEASGLLAGVVPAASGAVVPESATTAGSPAAVVTASIAAPSVGHDDVGDVGGFQEELQANLRRHGVRDFLPRRKT